MKRFYKVVSHEPSGRGYRILLDGRAVKTKSGNDLVVFFKDIADQIVVEWEKQGDVIVPDTMPLTQIVNTKIDHVLKNRENMSSMLLKYLDTDLLCYQVSSPRELVELQDRKWGQWVSWFNSKFGSALKTTTGLAAISQSSEVHDAVRKYVEGLSDDEFTILQIIVPLSGSLILGTAMVSGNACSQDLLEACFVEEDYKNTLYDSETCGTDPYIEFKKKATATDLQACEKYLKSLKI